MNSIHILQYFLVLYQITLSSLILHGAAELFLCWVYKSCFGSDIDYGKSESLYLIACVIY